jgi:hypothetical protein
LTGAIQEAFGKVEKSHIWMVADMKFEISFIEGALKGPGADRLGDKKPLLEAMVQAKPTFKAMGAAVGAGEVAVTLAIACKDEASAKQLATAAQTNQKNIKENDPTLQASLPKGPVQDAEALRRMVGEMLKTLKFSSDGKVMMQSFQVKLQDFEATFKKK